MQAIEDARKKLIHGIVGNLILATISFFVISFGVYIIVFMYTYDDEVVLESLAITCGLFVVGLCYQLRSWVDQWRSYSNPFEEVDSGGGFQMWSIYNQVFGSAYLINVVIMSASDQLLKAYDKFKRLAHFTEVEKQAADNVMDQLRNKGTTPRFHSLDFPCEKPVLMKLILMNVIWTKYDEDGKLLLGMNRIYDA